MDDPAKVLIIHSDSQIAQQMAASLQPEFDVRFFGPSTREVDWEQWPRFDLVVISEDILYAWHQLSRHGKKDPIKQLILLSEKVLLLGSLGSGGVQDGTLVLHVTERQPTLDRFGDMVRQLCWDVVSKEAGVRNQESPDPGRS